jgi:histidyl-tRNA synthetase
MKKEKKQIYKPRPVSGFPEWLPEVRLVEQKWFDHIRKIFESYGFCSIETPSVEELDVISAKGEVDKEIYVLERLHKEEDDDKEARLALHFDQTVPFARYTAQHFNDLVFPFKRYQMQRVWRGERPQAGRFREFYQCDIDVINVDHLPIHFDAEMPAIIWEVLSSLPGMEGEKIKLRISNRKILMGLLDALGIEDKVEITRTIDKLEKIGADEVIKLLGGLGCDAGQIDTIMSLAKLQTTKPDDITNFVNGLNTGDADRTMLDEGAEELATVLTQLQHLPEEAFVADLSIVRGLDYYTGTVYETVFVDDPSYGSICSGGRYDDLASQYINKKLPGVGISIGFSRLFSRLLDKGALPVAKKSAADILMLLPNADRVTVAAETARILRARGFNVEMYHAPQKIGKQFAYAEKKGIPFVWLPPFEDGQDHEIKDMTSGEQTAADPQEWHNK